MDSFFLQQDIWGALELTLRYLDSLSKLLTTRNFHISEIITISYSKWATTELAKRLCESDEQPLEIMTNFEEDLTQLEVQNSIFRIPKETIQYLKGEFTFQCLLN